CISATGSEDVGDSPAAGGLWRAFNPMTGGTLPATGAHPAPSDAVFFALVISRPNSTGWSTRHRQGRARAQAFRLNSDCHSQRKHGTSHCRVAHELTDNRKKDCGVHSKKRKAKGPPTRSGFERAS